MSTTVVQTSTVETEAQALHRLARQARERGVQILVDARNRHWSPSVSRPGHWHVVTLASCSCAGFCRHGRCRHFAAILAAYHCLPPLDPEPGPGGVALPVPAEDAVVLVQPARAPRPAVEGARVAHAGTRDDGSTYVIMHADVIVLDGVPHRVGDAVMVTDRRWGWAPARITCVRTVGSTGRVWKVDVDGTGYGETTRSLAEVRSINAVSSEGVRHAA